MTKKSILFVLAAVLLGCTAIPEKQYEGPQRDPSTLALVSTLGIKTGSFIREVDGKSLRSMGDGPAYIWLDPGLHSFKFRYEDAENYPVMAQSEGTYAASLMPGHTYLLDYHVDMEKRMVIFALRDAGPAFPIRCLPVFLLHVNQKLGKGMAWSDQDMRACLIKARGLDKA